MKIKITLKPTQFRNIHFRTIPRFTLLDLKSSGLICLLMLLFLNLIPAYSQLPSDFQKVELLTELTNSTTFKFAPDGRIFIVDRRGELVIYKPSTQSSVSAGTLGVYFGFEDGLLGIAFDPNFLSNNHIYIHYSPVPASNAVNRISRFTMNGDALDFTSEVIMLEWATQRETCCHAAGDMDFDSQGNLYISTGDNTKHSWYAAFDETDSNASAEKSSSNTNDLRGKILRITPQPNGTYTIPAGNLFPGGVGGLPEIYVMGARNPYRIFVDKENTDWLFWGEVGPDANNPGVEGPRGWDEINLTKSTGNFGWPYFSGPNEAYQMFYANPPYYNDPAAPVNISMWNTGATNLPPAEAAWLEFPSQCYLVGPRYYYDPSLTDQQRLPVEFDEGFFYFDFNTSQVWVVKMDANGNILSNEQLAPAIFPSASHGFIDMQLGPDGHLYILEYGAGCCPGNTGTGKLVRVDYTGIQSNSSPVVELSASPTSGAAPLTVDFSSAGTFDPDGDPLTYEWDFETDGTIDLTFVDPASPPEPTFIYTTAGDYNAQLRVDDGNGGISTKNITINAGNNAATFTFNSPLDGGMMNWGDDVNFDLLVEDIEDGSTSNGGIDCNDVSLVPSLGHLAHFHDDVILTGCPQILNLDPDGHEIYGEMDIYYVLGTNYTDSGGLQSFDQIQLHPKRHEAEYYDTQNDVTEISSTDPWSGSFEAVRVNHDSYIVFEGRNLSNISSVKYRVAAATIGGIIEMRLGSPTGTILATTTIPVTGSANTWIDVETSFTDPGTKNDLYFVFKNNPGQQDLFDLNYIEFIGNGVSVDNTPPEVNSVISTATTQVQVEFSEQVTQATAEQIANYSIDNGISVSAAVLQPNNRTVYLTTSSISAGFTYNITINNVENTSGLAVVSGSYPFSLLAAMRINTGGPEFIASEGTFIADQYANGGSTFTRNLPIDDTVDDELYQTERFGNFTYEIPLAVPGLYDVRLHFAELFFGAPGAGSGGGPGSRVFNVSIEGNPSLANFDILNEVAPTTALIKEFTEISVDDGFLTVVFSSVVNNAKISAIEVAPAEEPTPNITILSPTGGTDVNQPFNVNFSVENWTIQQGGTHMHYYIDGAMVGPHYSYDPISIEGLSLGNHTIRLELFLPTHTGTGVYDEVTVNVTDQTTCNTGTWPDQWLVHEIGGELPYRATSIIPFEDLDGDGLKDIVAGGWWYKNPGTASGTWIQNAIGSPFNSVAFIHDFDGDGDMDLFGTQNSYIGTDLVWAQNDGSGNFTIYSDLPSGASTHSERFIAGIAGGVYETDGPYQMAINWNGRPDTSELQMVTVPADPVNGTWTIENVHPGTLNEALSNGDIDGDGDLDLFQGGNWLRNEDGSWTEFSTQITYNSSFEQQAFTDIDGDGDLDGVVGQSSSNEEFAWFESPADPTQAWTKNIIDPDIDASISVFAADMDFDGDDDVIVGEWLGTYQLFGFENDLCNTGTWIKHTIDPGGSTFDHHNGAQVVDIDNDGDLDIVSIGWANLTPRIFENTTQLPNNTPPTADAGTDQTITFPGSVILNGSGNDPDGTITAYQWTQESGPGTATLSGDNTPDLTASDLVEGIYVFRLTVTDNVLDTGFDEVTVTVVTPASLPMRLNSGGPGYDFNGEDWVADQYNDGGFTFTTGIPIANTENDQLYQTERFTNTGTLTYEIPVSPGDYDIDLHFAELFYGVPGPGSGGGVGSRVFNVDIENGQVQLNNYDIVLAAGGSATAVIESFSGINVTDGNITITLSSVVQNAKISGIGVFENGVPRVNAGPDQNVTIPNDATLNGSAVDPDGGTIMSYQWTQESGPNTATLSGATTPDLIAGNLIVGTYVFRLTATDDELVTGYNEVTVVVAATVTLPLRVNSGGPTFNFNGEDWLVDQFFEDGFTFTDAIPIANTENDQLYQSERFTNSGALMYEIPVLPGNYRIELHFAELFYGVPGPGSGGGVGSRIFNIDIENGQQQLNNYDIVLEAGGSATAVIESFTGIRVMDGHLSINLTSVVQNAKLSGIAIFADEVPISDAGSDQSINLPENSVVLNGSGVDPDGGVITEFLWTQESGPGTATLSGSNTATLTASDLVEGTYVFRLTVTDDELDTGFDEVTVTVNPDSSNQPPVAIASATPLSGDAPLDVTFTGSNSTDDVGVVDYLWDFTDGGSSTEADPAYTFAMAGIYDVELTVEDAGGLTNTTSITITVNDPANEPPVALASATPLSGNGPLEVTFTGSSSTDDVGVVNYLWDFMDGGSSTEADPVYTFATAGIYDVELTVEDVGGLTNTTSITITVNDPANEPPVAIASATPLSGGVPLEVTFTGSSSTDDVGVISYLWDFGDGNTSIEADPIHIFNTAETYNVVLTVEDGSGLTDTETITIVGSGSEGELGGIIFPNPANDFVNVQVLNIPYEMSVLNIFLHDSSGRYVSSFAPQEVFVNGSYEIPISNLRDGIYRITLEMNTGKPLVLNLAVTN